MRNDRWIAYLIIGIIIHAVTMILLFEHSPEIANQINFSVIIGLLAAILLNVKK